MSIIEEVNNIITGGPYLIQISGDGIWEEAFRWKYSKGRPSIKKILNFLNNKDNIALEIFLKYEMTYDLFFGVRYNQNLKINIFKFLKVIKVILDEIYNIQTRKFSTIIRSLSKKLTNSNKYFLSKYPTTIELGILNYWKSYGSCIIWNSKDLKKISYEMIESRVRNHNNITKNYKNCQIMELNYEYIFNHWLGIQCSLRKKLAYYLDKNRILSLIKLLNFSCSMRE